MIEGQLKAIMDSVGVGSEPKVVRLYRDEDRSLPSLVVQRDFQGCRIMIRPKTSPQQWTCAWFADSGDLLSIERFACEDAALDRNQADEFLNLVLGQEFKDMAKETVSLS